VGASLLKSRQAIKQRADRYSDRRVALGSVVQGLTRLLVVEDDTQTANEIKAAMGGYSFDVERA
jgi:hypothetical protein